MLRLLFLLLSLVMLTIALPEAAPEAAPEARYGDRIGRPGQGQGYRYRSGTKGSKDWAYRGH